MRILIVGLNFHPELTGIGKYTGDMAAHLSNAGHQVRVITTPPYYPYWRVQPGYRWWMYRRETWCGVKVYRCPLWVPSHPSGVKRILHLLSFAISLLPVLFGQVLWRPQIVLCVAPALFSAPFALLAARLCGARAWLHIQDFELDAATQLGMLGSGHWLARWASRFESWLLRAFDRVSTLSTRMLARLEQKGVSPEQASLLPNWVDINTIYPLPDGGLSARKEFGLPANKLIVLYAGNMGVKQGLEIVVEAAWGLRKNSAFHFLFCGEGSAKDYLQRAAREMRNVQFLPLQPPEKLNLLLNVADIHILPQRPDAADLMMPSKLLGMLASGKPVIATASPGTEIGNIIGQVGLLVPPEEQPALCEALLELGISPQLRTSIGMKGRAYVCKYWRMEHILGEFEQQLCTLGTRKSKITGKSLLVKKQNSN